MKEEIKIEGFKHWVWVYNVEPTTGRNDRVYFTGDNFLQPLYGEYDLWPNSYKVGNYWPLTYLPWRTGRSWAKGDPDTGILISSTSLIWYWWAYYYNWNGDKYPSARTRYYDGSGSG